MSPGIASSVLFATIVATLGIAAAAAGDRSADSSATTSTGACAGLPGHDALRSALVNARGQDNGGFDLDMWGAIVNRDGIVCAVAFTGTDRGQAMAREPRDRCAESQHCERLQPADPVAVDRESLGGGTARRFAVRPAAQQSGQHERRVRGTGE